MKRISIIIFCTLFFSCEQETKNIKISGQVFGTTYTIVYDSKINFEKQCDSLFYVINRSMSTYLANSDISKINRNETLVVDEHFERVFQATKEIYKSTEGMFDPTIGAVVNAWDFGPEGKIIDLDSLKVDSLMRHVGLDKVRLNAGRIQKLAGTYLDFNAIAKGYAVDVIAEFLESKNITNYLIEIGGEINVKGMNTEKQKPWTVGIDKPNFLGEQSVLEVVSLKDEAMATSGTYRKFKTDENGNRYAHIIDTKTGYPSKTNILSVSVIAYDCMTADAYATAFQAMGIKKVNQFLKEHRELKVLLIIENDNGDLESISLNDFPLN
jgi:thiamine biosynthesis lipoprotein